MKRDKKILILMFGIIFIFTSLAMAYNLKEYFPLSEGDSWTYRVMKNGRFDKKVTYRIEGAETVGNVETVRMIFDENKYACIAFDPEGVKLYKIYDGDKHEIFTTPILAFPNIGLGESKTIKGDDKSTQILLESTIEDVEVTAGKFSSCLRFSSITKSTNGDSGTDNCTVWLAPGVGRVKETCVIINNEGDDVLRIAELIWAVINGKKMGQ